MKFFLSIKAWVVFVIIILPLAFAGPLLIVEILNIFGFCALFLWLFSIGYYGSKKLAEMRVSRPGDINLFIIFCLIAPVVLFVFILLRDEIGEGPLAAVLALAGSTAYLYTFFLVSKIIVTLEKERKVSLSEYIWTFVLLGLLPLGIWFIQPRVNDIFAVSPVGDLSSGNQ